MPPIGRDDKNHAAHVLNVLDCAKALVAALAQAGGLDKADASKHIGVRDALKTLFDQTSKLQIYEARAKARGTLAALDDEQMAMAIKDVRERRVLTADEAEVLDATPEQVAESFSLETPEGAAAPVETEEPAPDSGLRKSEDAFSIL